MKPENTFSTYATGSLGETASGSFANPFNLSVRSSWLGGGFSLTPTMAWSIGAPGWEMRGTFWPMPKPTIEVTNDVLASVARSYAAGYDHGTVYAALPALTVNIATDALFSAWNSWLDQYGRWLKASGTTSVQSGHVHYGTPGEAASGSEAA